jgi:predicted nucleic acid-binding protein
MSAERVLVDTWGWLALADDREPRHPDVRALIQGAWRQAHAVLTTDYILDETFTLVFRRLLFAKARRFVSTIETAERQGSLQVERISPERFALAKKLRLRFRDKPLISFTDLTSMVVMQELRMKRVLTADEHFRHVGLGFELQP